MHQGVENTITRICGSQGQGWSCEPFSLVIHSLEEPFFCPSSRLLFLDNKCLDVFFPIRGQNKDSLMGTEVAKALWVTGIRTMGRKELLL